MTHAVSSRSRLTFGVFEAELDSGELWKGGHRVKLQSQPFKILTVLLENAGKNVTREELQLRVWGPDVVVDFDHSLGSAIKKVREALGDSADNPRFIETLVGRGYRFIAPVSVVELVEETAPSTSIYDTRTNLKVEDSERRSPNVSIEETRPPSKWRPYAMPIISFAIGIAITATVLQLWRSPHFDAIPPRLSQFTHDGHIYSHGDPSLEAMRASVSNGERVFTSSVVNGRVSLSQISAATGETLTLAIPSEITAPEICDISPDGARLLVRGHNNTSEQPLWIVPIDGRSAFRVPDILAHDATWMPDGKSILYASANQLFTVSPQGGKPTTFATVFGRAFWLRWSPDGKLLRFTLLSPTDHTASLWEIEGRNSTARPVITAARTFTNDCCGTWTSDGKLFVFQASQNGQTDLWKLSGALRSYPVQITNGPLRFEAPAAGRNGGLIYFVGHESKAELEQFDRRRKEFVPLRNFLTDAIRVSYSRDKLWVAWTDWTGRLWRAKFDGTEKIQLTPDSLEVFLANWSPNGTQLTLMAREAGGAWNLYMISAEGGTVQKLLQNSRNVGDPSFSSDGKRIVFGRVPNRLAEDTSSHALGMLDLETSQVFEVPQSQGLFSPRWSPDGRFIAALTLDQQKVMVYDLSLQTWKTLSVPYAADPVWSSDSRSLYVHASNADTEPIYRVSIPDGQMEEVASLKNFVTGSVTRYFFSGLGRDDVPLVRVESLMGDLYTMDPGSR